MSGDPTEVFAQPFPVQGAAFECGQSCGTVLRNGDTAYFSGGQMVCADCVTKKG